MGDYGPTVPLDHSTNVDQPSQPQPHPSNEISVLITGFGVSDLHQQANHI